MATFVAVLVIGMGLVAMWTWAYQSGRRRGYNEGFTSAQGLLHTDDCIVSLDHYVLIKDKPIGQN